MRKSVYLLVLAGTVFLAGNASADEITEITIADGRVGSGTWYSSTTEDQEVEPGMQNWQQWDLEGFFQTGDILSVVGGYDFKNGYSGTTSGDIFISIDANFGDNTKTNFGYEYVFNLDFVTMQYTLFELGPNAKLDQVQEQLNIDATPTSNPWKYSSGGTAIETNAFSYGITSDYKFLGTTHYEISGFDLSFLRNLPGLDIGDAYWVHTTMSCGNDNLMGQGTVPVPEPATMLLFGTGIAGLAGMARRKKINNNS